jgi:hypothetical protein
MFFVGRVTASRFSTSPDTVTEQEDSNPLSASRVTPSLLRSCLIEKGFKVASANRWKIRGGKGVVK